MMDNASLFYDEINSYEDIKNLIGTREDIFIDFKQTASRDGKLIDDDKANFSKAASGFAHQQGGVLVWGISTAIDNTEVSRATELKPISRVDGFCSALYSFIRNSTEPPVDGIRHKVIHENDRKGSDAGFVVSLFPKSHRVHRSLSGKTRNAFYKRHGDGFYSLSTEEIKALFFRTLTPDIELIAFPRDSTGMRYSDTKGPWKPFWIGLSLDNKGNGLGKSCSAYIWLQGDRFCNWNVVGWFDAKGRRTFETNQLLPICDRSTGKILTDARHIKMGPGIVICPGEQIDVAIVGCRYREASGPLTHSILHIKYKILAENMIPKEKIIEF